ncbi:MAG: homoserine kinase [Verrucomicrobiia bacterium]
MKLRAQSATCIVPATTANLGSGFDTLGVALQWYNRVRIDLSGRRGASPMAQEAASLFWATTRIEPRPFGVQIAGDIPPARGLGSSVTIRLAVLMGLNALFESPLTRLQLFTLCTQLEGHPDNAAPACFGGFAVAWREGVLRFPVSSKLRFIILVPSFEMPTTQARAVLPERISFPAAVTAVQNSSRITAAFASKAYQPLKGAFRDPLHQPYRLNLMPFLDDAIMAGESAGALGGFLSGSGSSIACLTLSNPEAVADAMAQAAARHSVKSQTFVCNADNNGARVSLR